MRWALPYLRVVFLTAILSTSAHGVGIAISNVSGLAFGEGVQGDTTQVVAAGTSETAMNGSYNITGNPNATYNVTFPASVKMTNGAGCNIVVNAFSKGTATGLFQLSADGSQTLFVGGTRDALASNQGTGNYTVTLSTSVQYTSGGPKRAANAATTGSVITAISIASVSILDFGIVALGDGAAEIPAGTSENTSNCSFNVTGQANRTYTIVLPSNATLITNGGGVNRNFVIHTFTSFPSRTGTLSADGTQLLLVGATRPLIPSGNDPGVYCGTFNVVVAY